MHATYSENILEDPDFRAAFEGDGGQTVLQALKDKDERGVIFQTLGTEQYSGKSYLSGGELPVGLSEEVLKAGDIARKQLKSLKKVDKPRHFLSVSLLNEEIKPKLNSVDKFVNESFPIMVKAVDEMHASKDKYAPERYYVQFFEELTKNLHDWRLFFSVENDQYLWAEKVVPVLGNLSAIYRQRRRYADCDNVMRVYKEILDLFQEMIARRRAAHLSDDNELVNCRCLVYKYHRVAVNLGADLLRPDNLAPSYRNLFQYEIDTKIVDTPEEEFIWIFEQFLGKSKTTAALAATTDAELDLMAKRLFVNFRLLNFSPEYQRENVYPGVQLAQCAGCCKVEPFLNTFKLCSRCKSVKYCGKDCQVAHYKAHKKQCKQNAK